MLKILVFCFMLQISSGFSFVTEALHDYMTEAELAYYFQTPNKHILPDYEVIHLPIVKEALEAGQEEFDYNFSAFQRPINLKLKRNEVLISPNMKTYLHEDGRDNLLPTHPKECHYLYKNDSFSAAFSLCTQDTMQGFLFLEDGTLEIRPLTARLKDFIRSETNDERVPHLIKKASLRDTENFMNDHFPIAGVIDTNQLEKASHRPAPGLTLELAMFFDEAAYKIFAPYMNYDHQAMRDMLLAYLNGVQALYHHPSLGTSLQLVLVRLDIMKTQPSGMPHYEGERGKLLDSFCIYQDNNNPTDDSNPEHWDMALYISGLDFFAYENGRKSGATMGLATVGGVCLGKYACVIAELGTTNVFGKPYPSAGFTSVYILAHEIGHNLGMHHDSVGNNCPKEGYVMSPSRGTNGETKWSTCSADVMSKISWATCLEDSGKQPKLLDHNRFLDNPGQAFTAKKQCEILLRDKDAVMSPGQELSSICYNLQCKTPHRSGYYFAGPALEGTPCGNEKYCYGGDCVYKEMPKPVRVVPGGWSPWKKEQCSSGCIEKSRGFQMKRRTCDNPAPINTDEGCDGSSIDIITCDDTKICPRKKQSVIDYASEKCQEFSKLLPELDKEAAGLQAPHEEDRLWMACAIFCRRADSGSFYTPRLELNDLGVSAYFPDGTWCHREGNINHYCLYRHCLPESFKFWKGSSILQGIGQDIPYSQNARPNLWVPPELKSYLSLDANGKPLKTILKPNEIGAPNDEEWETDDFVEIPELEERRKFRM